MLGNSHHPLCRQRAKLIVLVSTFHYCVLLHKDAFFQLLSKIRFSTNFPCCRFSMLPNFFPPIFDVWPIMLYIIYYCNPRMIYYSCNIAIFPYLCSPLCHLITTFFIRHFPDYHFNHYEANFDIFWLAPFSAPRCSFHFTTFVVMVDTVINNLSDLCFYEFRADNMDVFGYWLHNFNEMKCTAINYSGSDSRSSTQKANSFNYNTDCIYLRLRTL